MLHSLYIQNYALIEQLDINFEKGFSVITGETGAGKSIMLGALGLLLGQRADVKSIRDGASKCVIEARFSISEYNMQSFFEENELEYENECILRREVYASGKSRAFVNDTPVNLVQIKELGDQLIDIHSQHQNLLLNKEDFQLSVLDTLAFNDELLTLYHHTYDEWKKLERELKKVKDEAAKSRADEEYIRFQLEELDEAKLVDGEEERLNQEIETLTHAEDIKGALFRIDQSFSSDDRGVVSELKECLNTLISIRGMYQPAVELSDRMDSLYIELKEIAREIGKQVDDVEFNPARLEELNQRLDEIIILQRKHNVQTVGELIELTAGYREKLNMITSCDERIEELVAQRDHCFKKLKEQAAVLSERRASAAKEVEKQMMARLVPLGMPNIRFRVEIGKRNEPVLSGEDTVTFLFSANKNGSMQPVSTVASGGEIARVMLSMKAMIAGAVKLPTIIFDEIDTGVSGEIADRMADIMQEMGEQDRQVISITHLPQIAARGKAHYLVYKRDSDTETNSHIRMLTDEERVNEIAQMLSGARLTEAALNNARELLRKSLK